jgi:hypothetical protein
MNGKTFYVGYRDKSYCQGNLVAGLWVKGQQPAANEQGEKKEKGEKLE